MAKTAPTTTHNFAINRRFRIKRESRIRTVTGFGGGNQKKYDKNLMSLTVTCEREGNYKSNGFWLSDFVRLDKSGKIVWLD